MLSTPNSLWQELSGKRVFSWRYNLGKNQRKKGTCGFQEPLFLSWLAGFIDGEGCFKVAIKKKAKAGIGFEVMPSIDISQSVLRRDKMESLSSLLSQRALVEHKSIIGNDMACININRFEDIRLLMRDIYPYLFIKKAEGKVYMQILDMIADGKHLTFNGFLEIVKLRERLSPLRTKPNTYRNYSWFQNYFKSKEKITC